MFSIGFMTGMMYLWITSYPRTVIHNDYHVKMEILEQENFMHMMSNLEKGKC
jgi:hypothetical protein